MRNILQVGKGFVDLNAIFIQPTRLCANNCKGCYVKEHFPTTQAMPIELFKSIITETYEGTRLKANQITISFDRFSDLEKSVLQAYMFATRDAIKEAEDRGFKEKGPEIHGTFFDTKSLKDYCVNDHVIENTFKMISISNLEVHEISVLRAVHPTLHINLNHLIPSNINSSNIDSYIKKMETLGKGVSSIYLVIHKVPVGRPMTSEEVLRVKNRLSHDLAVINTLNKRLSPAIRAKLIYDGCLQDVAKFNKDGFGCSSNVSRVQIWPDGTVTGCAYAWKSSTKPTDKFSDLLDNIIHVRSEYDFHEKCYLPSFYLSK